MILGFSKKSPRERKNVAPRAAVGPALLLFAAMASCSSSNVHIFTASEYDPDNNCLKPPAAIDVLEGEEPVRCNQVVCWLNPNNGTAVVSEGVCDGPVGWNRVDSASSGSICDEALKAYALGKDCA